MSIDEIVTLFFLKLNTIELNYSQQELIDFDLQSIYSERKVSEATREVSEDFFMHHAPYSSTTIFPFILPPSHAAQAWAISRNVKCAPISGCKVCSVKKLKIESMSACVGKLL